MPYLVMAVKSVAWLCAFWFGIRLRLVRMLLLAAALTLFLTLVDRLAGNASFAGMSLTLTLYALMCFILLPVAWKMKNPAVSLGCNVAGTLGALALVDFTAKFLLTRLLLLN